MKDFRTFLLLPAGLLSLVFHPIVQAQGPPGTQNLPRTDEYSLDHDDLIRRQWQAQERLATQAPVGVRKMSGDEGEKFFLHYWDFGESYNQLNGQGNASIPVLSVPGMMPHCENNGPGMMLFRRGLFARDFKCPGDTHSCKSSIGANICCEPGQTCIATTNGPACCPSGQTCGNTIGACPKGYKSCKGGCCINGSVCKGNGCLIVGTQTTTTTLPTVTKTSGVSPTTVTGTGKTVTVFIPTVIVTTKTITENSNGGTTKTVIVSHGTTEDSTNTKVSPNRPVLPTSVSASTQASNSLCWPGYYMCSAHYIGCCKIGRNCDTTHCPPTGTTITEKNGVTIVESAPTALRGPCGSGLHSCPASDYGGCCPTGYDCGIQSCTAKGKGMAETAKVAPGSANIPLWAPGLMACALTVGIGMILL